VFPAGVYYITQEIALPNANGWAIRALGEVVIEQGTPNSRAFYIQIAGATNLANGLRGWKCLGRWFFCASTPQPNTATNSAGFALESAGSTEVGFFNFEIEDFTFAGFYRGFTIGHATIQANYALTVWGYIIRNLAGAACSGAMHYITSPSGQGGSPRCLYENVYVYSDNNSNETNFQLTGGYGVTILNMEFNHTTTVGLELTTSGQSFIGNIRFEGCTFSWNFGAFVICGGAKSGVVINNIELTSVTINVANYAYIVASQIAGCVVTVGNMLVENCTLTSGAIVGLLPQGGVFRFNGDWNSDNAVNQVVNIYTSPQNVIYANQTVIGQFGYAGLTANLSGANCSTAGGVAAFLAPCNGYLVGGSAKCNNPITAGSLTATLNVNGVANANLSMALSSSAQAAQGYAPGFFAGTAVSAGDLISAKITTTSDFAAGASPNFYGAYTFIPNPAA
jgi:hypothetical protein